jgi:hypothetical protein
MTESIEEKVRRTKTTTHISNVEIIEVAIHNGVIEYNPHPGEISPNSEEGYVEMLKNASTGDTSYFIG